MKWGKFIVALTAAAMLPFPAPAELSFTGSYSWSETTEEETRESDGLTIIYPADQDDILVHLLPLISQHQKARASVAREEATAIREVIAKQEPNTAKIVKTLLSQETLSDSFSEHFTASIEEMNAVIDAWETWSGHFSTVHFYNRATAKPFMNREKKTIDFGETKYTFQGEGQVNMAILPPFVARYGAGMEKLDTGKKDIEGFRWDIGVFAPPGVGAEASAKEIARLFPVLSNLQSGVAKQIAVKWIRYYIVERMLRHEIRATYFADNDNSRHLVNGLARLYLFGFLNNVEKDRMNVMLPNLVHFPVPEGSPQDYIDQVERLDPLAPVDPKMETAASRIVMYGLLKESQEIEGDIFPLQLMEKNGIAIPKGGFEFEDLVSAIRKVYPAPDRSFAAAAQEITQLMRTNFQEKSPAEEDSSEPRKTSVFPDTYQETAHGDLTITAPSSLSSALEKLGPEWDMGLRKTAGILKRRFDREPVPAISFEEEDYDGIRQYGIEVEPSQVELWVLQTAVSNNVEQAFSYLFDGNKIEIWFKDDLIDSLKKHGNTELYSWNESTEKVSANFSFEIPSKTFRGASVKQLLQRYNELEPPVFPVVIKDRSIEKATVEKQIAAIREGDYLIGGIIAGAEELSPSQLSGKSGRLLDEKETFFVVVHEVVEGFLIQKVVASRDRRWFCDGLANWIAMQECDRRFGDGSGKTVLEKMFNRKVSESLSDQVDLLAWTAIENKDENLSTVKGLEGAHYYYATQAVEKALAGRGPEFVESWIDRIRETRWIRTNAKTIFDSFDTLAGGDLREIVVNITK